MLPNPSGGDGGGYALLEHCVRRLLGDHDTQHRLTLLADLALQHGHDYVPAALSPDTAYARTPRSAGARRSRGSRHALDAAAELANA